MSERRLPAAPEAPRRGRPRAGEPGPKRRRFGHVRRLASGRYQAIYRDGQGRRQVADHPFVTKAEAEQFLAITEADMLRGECVDPLLRRASFAEWAAEW